MPGAVDLLHHFGHAVGHPAKNEERAAFVVPAEELEDLADAGGGPEAEAVPICPPHGALERRDLEVFLDVDGEVVTDHGRSGLRPGAHRRADRRAHRNADRRRGEDRGERIQATVHALIDRAENVQ